MMRSVENATTALRDGDADRAIKMMLSADELCHKVIAPPTIHGLAMRVLSDAYLAKDNMEDAKKALEKGLSLCKPHDGRANMPPFMKVRAQPRGWMYVCALAAFFRGSNRIFRSLGNPTGKVGGKRMLSIFSTRVN